MTEKDTVVLGYSGGLDTSILLKMLKTRKQWFVKSKARLVDEKSKLNKVENLLKSVIKSYLSSDNSKGAKLKSENR